MQAIYIPQLTKAPQSTTEIDFSEVIPDLETLTPVQGRIQVTHQGNYLKVTAQAETIVTLTCDRCLQQYNYRLKIAPSELIWLSDTGQPDEIELLDQEITTDDLVETLSPKGFFDPTTWIYEQLCLELPQKKLCEPDCPGIQLSSETTGAIDQRWSSLASLKQQLSDRN
ncbi:MAG TPA: YceD family protein [Thermosynechococcaceae cyanobacterium]